MEDMMTPEDRLALIEKVSAKVKDLTDDDLRGLAKELGAEMIEDADKMASKDLADAMMAKPVVDTGTLTGPMPALKSFLLKSQRDKEKQ